MCHNFLLCTKRIKNPPHEVLEHAKLFKLGAVMRLSAFQQVLSADTAGGGSSSSAGWSSPVGRGTSTVVISTGDGSTTATATGGGGGGGGGGASAVVLQVEEVGTSCSGGSLSAAASSGAVAAMTAVGVKRQASSANPNPYGGGTCFYVVWCANGCVCVRVHRWPYSIW